MDAMKNLALAAALAFAFATAVQAQAVWRCGPGGHAYADSPCPDGQPVAVADPRSAAQLSAAREVAAAQRELARRMVQERRENERHALSFSGMAGIRAPAAQPVKAPAQPPKKKLRRGREAGDIWPAIVRVTRHNRG